MKDIYEVLDSLGIEYTKYEHPAVYTVEEAKKVDRGLGKDVSRTKNLFLRNKKGNKHYLVVLGAAKRANLESLVKDLDESDLSFASPERMMKYLGLTPGSVSPFGLINDLESQVQVIVDEGLLKFPKQGFHPNINTATLVITTDDFKKFLESTQNNTTYLNL